MGWHPYGMVWDGDRDRDGMGRDGLEMRALSDHHSPPTSDHVGDAR
jgi:hypothetical protein